MKIHEPRRTILYNFFSFAFLIRMAVCGFVAHQILHLLKKLQLKRVKNERDIGKIVRPLFNKAHPLCICIKKSPILSINRDHTPILKRFSRHEVFSCGLIEHMF